MHFCNDALGNASTYIEMQIAISGYQSIHIKNMLQNAVKKII